MTASMDCGAKAPIACRESAWCSSQETSARSCTERRSSAICRTRDSHGATTRASSLAGPMPTSGPKCRFPMERGNSRASARSKWSLNSGGATCAMLSRKTRTLCKGRGLIEFDRRSFEAASGKVLNGSPLSKTRDRCGSSITPSISRRAIARSAILSPHETRDPEGTCHVTLVRAAKQERGCASIPTLATRCFLHSTTVVPVPQKGSRTVWPSLISKRSR